jgi:hypothetical protein
LVLFSRLMEYRPDGSRLSTLGPGVEWPVLVGQNLDKRSRRGDCLVVASVGVFSLVFGWLVGSVQAFAVVEAFVPFFFSCELVRKQPLISILNAELRHDEGRLKRSKRL